MKYFFDTEFIEDGKTIELISIGIVSEDGREYYAVSSEYKYRKADEWVRKNVIIPAYTYSVHGDHRNFLSEKNFHKTKGKTKKEIARDIQLFVANTKPEFYAYYADYDWVVFCRLFGRMVDLPEDFPMFCMDLKQMMVERGLDREWIDEKVPQDKYIEHVAVEDAAWNYELYKKLVAIPL